MRRPDLVHEHLQIGVAGGQRAGGAGVVEMDVGEHQRARLDVPQPLQKGVQTARGARVHDQARR